MLHYGQHMAEMTLQRSLRTACWVLGQSHSSSSSIQSSLHTVDQNRQFDSTEIPDLPNFHQAQALIAQPSHLTPNRLPKTIDTWSSSQVHLYNLPEKDDRLFTAGFDPIPALDNAALPIEGPIRPFYCEHPKCLEWFVTWRQFQYALLSNFRILR